MTDEKPPRDIFKGITRQTAKDVETSKNSEIIKYFKEHPKIFPKIFNIEDPFKLSKFDKMTECQELVKKYANLFKIFGAIAINSPCGSAKTLAGIYLIYYYGCKTLIISSRNAINDQWKTTIKNLYPGLTINGEPSQKVKRKTENGEKNKAPLIYIYTPQYLVNHADKFPADVNLIIYDEIHSLISNEFKKVLFIPEEQIKQGKREILPYMLALSATYPKNMNLIHRFFGKPIPVKSSITKTPVYIHDFHAYFHGKTTFENSDPVGIDWDYINPNEYQFIDFLIYGPEYNNFKLKPQINEQLKKFYNVFTSLNFSEKFKTFIITNTIDASVYAALLFAQKYKFNAVVIRSNTDKSYLITPDSLAAVIAENIKTEGEEIKKTINGGNCNENINGHGDKINDIKSDKSMISEQFPDSVKHPPKNDVEEFGKIDERQTVAHFTEFKKIKHLFEKINDYREILPRCAFVAGCHHRLKEGISINEATTLICTKFIYSLIWRVQILGRIRRTTNDEETNNRQRVALVMSSNIPTNVQKIKALRRHGYKSRKPYGFEYDFTDEAETFKKENYIYLNSAIC